MGVGSEGRTEWALVGDAESVGRECSLGIGDRDGGAELVGGSDADDVCFRFKVVFP